MLEFLLKYPQTVFDQGQLILVREWPLWIAISLLVLGGLIIAGLMIMKRGALPFAQLASIGFLQLTMLALVLWMIWQPSIVIEQLRTGDNVVAVMLDTSESMAYGEGDVSRMQQARSVLGNNTIGRLQQLYAFQRYVFSDAAQRLDSFEVLPAPAKSTRIGDSLLQVLGTSRTTPLAAVILVSDGADNTGALSQAQLAEISGYGVPIHTVGVGRDRIEEDLELQEVTLPAKALPGTILSARVSVRHDAAGTARVKVHDDDRLLTTSEIRLQPDTSVTTAWIDVPVADAGYRALRFSVDPVAGEQITENNTLTRVVEVKEESYRILYVEGEPRWEYKFMRRAMARDPSVELVSLLRVSQNKFYRQGVDSPEELEDGFPENRAELFSYDALIIGSIEAASFTPEQQLMIHDFVSERGGSLLMIAGLNGLGSGGWENSHVSEALPARLPSAEPGLVRKRARAVLTPAGLRTAMLKLSEDPDENNRLWQGLPEIADYQPLGTLKPASVSLINLIVDGSQHPLMVTQPYGNGYSYIFATGGTWRWQMSLPYEDQRHETFWRQFLRELVINSPGRFNLSTQVEADRVRINAEVRDESFKPERELKLTAVVTPEQGEAMSIELQPSAEYPGVMTGGFSADQSGIYSIEAISRREDQPVDSARVAIHHDSGTAEYFSLRRNQTLLDQLAAATGGSSWLPADISGLEEAIRYSPAGITERELRPLWDAPLVFLLLLMLKASEWLLRRRWKSI